MAPHIRTVKTSSGARAVQIVYSRRRGARQIEHIGSAHDEVELELLRAVARQRLAAGQHELDLGLDGATAGTAGATTGEVHWGKCAISAWCAGTGRRSRG